MMTSSLDDHRRCANQSASSRCTNSGRHLCSGCGEEIYCSKECQRIHWPTHKVQCQKAVKPEAASFLKSIDSLSIKQLKNIMKAKAASMDTKKRALVLSQLDQIVEKPSLVKFVEEHVQRSEIEGLLSTSGASSSSSSNGKTISSSSSSSGSKSKQGGRSSLAGSAAGAPPTAQQMRQQASMMRNNLALVRQSNPAFKNMTDDQIRQYADQMEQAADDPAMMKEIERMSQLSDKDKVRVQNIQEGLSGNVPMDEKWVRATVQVLKANPDIFKTLLKGKGAMFGGLSDEQIGGFIDYVSSMEASTLKMIFNALIFLGSCYKPLLSLYSTVDAYTLGSARYLLFGLGCILFYYSAVVTIIVVRWVVTQQYAVVMFIYRLLSSGSSGPSTLSSSSVPEGGGASPVTGGLGESSSDYDF